MVKVLTLNEDSLTSQAGIEEEPRTKKLERTNLLDKEMDPTSHRQRSGAARFTGNIVPLNLLELVTKASFFP